MNKKLILSFLTLISAIIISVFLIQYQTTVNKKSDRNILYNKINIKEINTSKLESNIKAMWVWEPNYILSNEEEITELINFCKINSIDRLYFEIDSDIDDRIASLIKKVHDNNIFIEALSGKGYYNYPKNHESALAIVNKVLEYNLKCEETYKFDGIHFDHEPFLLPEFKSDSNILISYLELLDKAKKLIKSKDSSLLFSTDIACWYDSGDIYATYKNERKTLDKHSIDLTDYVVIMDYTNIYNDILRNADDEILYCEENRKKAVIALETQNLPNEPEYVSYFELGKSKLQQHINKFDNYYSNKIGYGGYAIHYYNSYKILRE